MLLMFRHFITIITSWRENAVKTNFVYPYVLIIFKLMEGAL